MKDVKYYPYGGMRSSSGTANVNYLYTGQELDPETGLYYYGARYYNPELGRFISPDSLVPEPADPQTLNRYSYVRNNPILYTDPTGHLFLVDDIIIGAIIGAVVGAVTSGIQSGWDGDAMLMGAATGAIGGAFFGAAGGIIEHYGVSSILPQTAMHAGAGAISGGINSAITGGDVGMGMLVGGISAGFAKYAGQYLPGDYKQQFAARTALGGVTGGIVAEVYGGNFSDGFYIGAATSAVAMLANDVLHDIAMSCANDDATSAGGYVDIGASGGTGRSGASIGVQFSRVGLYGYLGIGSGSGVGASTTYNPFSEPSEGLAVTGVIRGGYMGAGAEAGVSYAGNGLSCVWGAGVGVGFGGAVTGTYTVRITDWSFMNNVYKMTEGVPFQ